MAYTIILNSISLDLILKSQAKAITSLNVDVTTMPSSTSGKVKLTPDGIARVDPKDSANSAKTHNAHQPVNSGGKKIEFASRALERRKA